MDNNHSSSDEDIPLAKLMDKDEHIPLAKLKSMITEQSSSESEGNMSFDEEDYDSDRDPEYRPGSCEVRGCKDEVFAACPECEILLCYDHCVEDILSCDQHGKILKVMRKKQKNLDKQPMMKNSSQNGNGEGSSIDENAQGGPVEMAISQIGEPEQFTIEGSAKEVPDKERSVKRFNKQKFAREMRNKGLQYTSVKTKQQVKARELKPRCKGTACRKQCSKITDEQRSQIFRAFWDLGELILQREFVVRHIRSTDTKRKTKLSAESRRTQTLQYTLTVNQQIMPVCKVFFHNTLGISEQISKTALKKKLATGVLEGEKRGGKISEKVKAREKTIREEIQKHMDRFPRVESHYCRSSSSKEYLHPDLTKPRMYNMFLEVWGPRPNPPSYSLYRTVFKDNNLSFHRPKKDQCTLCLMYRQGNPSEKEQLKDRYETHIAEKIKVREIKDACKNEACQDKTVRSACFDLQQVIYLPKCEENAIFYKRRLSNFNLTVYNLSDRDCHCFTWHEGESKRGSSEISTAVYKILMMYDAQGVKKANLFADGCSGQNKNSIMPAMMLHTVTNSNNLQEISLRFFESFHGQNEGDSAHSAIHSALVTAGNLYQPSQLLPVFRLARPKQPYIIHQLQFNDFLDFKSLSKALRILDAPRDSGGNEQLPWNSIMELCVRKDHPTKIYFKTSHTDKDFQVISLKRLSQSVSDFELTLLNKEKTKLSKDKYQDLVSLCTGQTPVIRIEEHKKFYLSLPHE